MTVTIIMPHGPMAGKSDFSSAGGKRQRSAQMPCLGTVNLRKCRCRAVWRAIWRAVWRAVWRAICSVAAVCFHRPQKRRTLTQVPSATDKAELIA